MNFFCPNITFSQTDQNFLPDLLFAQIDFVPLTTLFLVDKSSCNIAWIKGGQSDDCWTPWNYLINYLAREAVFALEYTSLAEGKMQPFQKTPLAQSL